jgi:hypothetical protein
MAKLTHASKGKGILDIDFNEGYGKLTLVDKNGGETVWDFFEILQEFNGKNISYNISVDEDISPIGE